jgi:ubiquinone/menaquinone biosynthesis C-methylase UbiE
MNTEVNFAYPWWLSYGHLVVVAVAVPLFLVALRRKWRWPLAVVTGALALWSISAFLAVRFGFDPNGRAALPTPSFLSSGAGRVLDMGAGTGRSSIMVLEARPQATLVALDEFGSSYEQHFGEADLGRQRLLANFRAAGVANRATIQSGDMRHMPLGSESFDAIVSAYAIDHLNREGIQMSLAEAARVLKPNGELLLMVIHKDFWANYTWGLALMHMRMAGPEFWPQSLHEAGFDVVEQGFKPATLYLLARKHY